MAQSNAVSLINLGMPAELAKALQAMIEEAVLGTGAVSNVNVAADAAIATSKLADATPLAALVTDATPLAALADDATALGTLADVDTELLELAAAVTTPATALADLSVTGTYATDDTPIETAVNGILAILRSSGLLAAA